MTAQPHARIQTIDAVRGVAVMGILLMNIIAFAMPEAAYMNPRAYGGAEGANLWVYLVNFVLFDGKMRGLFSFLFGASTLLVIERAEAKGENPARVHYMRMIWLFVFGLIHLYLIWWGDILSLYAPIGMIAFFFRKRPTARLIGIGVLLIVLQSLLMAVLPFSYHMLENMARLHPDQPQWARQLASFNDQFGLPAPQKIAKDLALFRGSYAEIVTDRIAKHGGAPISAILFVGPETLGYMLLGMAALKSGLFAGAWEKRRYLKWMAIGFGIGIPAYVALAAYLVRADFSPFSILLAVVALSTPLRPLMIVGWACLIVLLARAGGPIALRLAATGRMAFTNYLVTSLICTTLFYGYGLGWYGYFGRAQVYLVVFAIWAAMLLWSKPWLARFQYGPFEWAWRSLSRLKLQPMAGGAYPSTARSANATQ